MGYVTKNIFIFYFKFAPNMNIYKLFQEEKVLNLKSFWRNYSFFTNKVKNMKDYSIYKITLESNIQNEFCLVILTKTIVEQLIH